jgi:AraC-like DNA-binding protein
MAGFTEMSYFRKIFKEFYGVTPSDYANGVGPRTEITDPIEN